MNIGEIAKMAGVSNAAVSRYFNKGYISEEKREAIRKVVEETGYHPSIQAQTLRTKKTKMIGVILPKIDSAAMGSIVAGILSVLNENEYQLLLADTQNNPKKELEYLSVFNNKRVDGVIFIATVFTALHKQILKKMLVPVVIVGQKLTGYNSVYHDDYHAIYDITKLILGKGRKKLGYISVLHQDKAAGLERYQGYKNAVCDAGFNELAQNYIIASFSIDSGYEKVKKLLENCKDLDALICATDSIAIGAMQYLKEQKIEIPRQMIITGHGDSSLSKVTSPTLTTIRFFYEDSGALAAKRMLEILDKNDTIIKEIKMGYSIVENESSFINLEQKDQIKEIKKI